MNLNTKTLLLSCFIIHCSNLAVAATAEEKIVKEQIKAAGFVPAADLYRNPDESLSDLGKIFFESNKGLS